jgi:hypothetical protein
MARNFAASQSLFKLTLAKVLPLFQGSNAGYDIERTNSNDLAFPKYLAEMFNRLGSPV